MKSRLIVAAIIENDGKYLLGQKPQNIGPYPNTWHLLGGGVELDEESLTDAVKREIQEEAGLELTNIERASFDEDYEPNKHGEMVHYVFLVYKATALSQDARPKDDIVELKWFTKEELRSLSLTRPSIKLFRELGWL